MPDVCMHEYMKYVIVCIYVWMYTFYFIYNYVYEFFYIYKKTSLLNLYI